MFNSFNLIGNSGTLRDFSLRKNHLAGYPSFLTEEHNKMLNEILIPTSKSGAT